MELPAELLPPTEPMMSLPGRRDDIHGWLLLELNLNWLPHFVRDFGAAVVLAEHARELHSQGNVAHRWLNMAGREGAINLRDYTTCFETVRDLCGKEPAIRAALDMGRMRELENSIGERFPYAKRPRHGSTHTAAWVTTVDDLLRHARKTGDGNLGWSPGGHLGSDNVFRVHFSPNDTSPSDEFNYDLTRDALLFLVANLRDLFGFFAPFYIEPF